jgi:hypothetical protein
MGLSAFVCLTVYSRRSELASLLRFSLSSANVSYNCKSEYFSGKPRHVSSSLPEGEGAYIAMGGSSCLQH